ncbi:MAG: GerMN domain-containing protein [Candidatus Firestonebacteria bacterium]
MNKKNIIKILILIVLLGFFGYIIKRIIVPDSTGVIPPVITGKEELIPVNLYFASLDENYLIPEERNIYKTESINDRAKQAIIELIKGPVTPNLSVTISKGTYLRELYIDAQKIAYADFSKELKEGHPGGTSAEIITIYSIVNTLAKNFPLDISKVQILIEGNPVETLVGHLDLSSPLGLNDSLIKESKEVK